MAGKTKAKRVKKMSKLDKLEDSLRKSENKKLRGFTGGKKSMDEIFAKARGMTLQEFKVKFNRP